MSEVKKLRRLNNEIGKKLTKENGIIMTDMVCYIRGSGLSEKNQELIRQDLLEMALSAQERKEPFSAVVGEDYKGFCNEIISSMPQMTTKEKIVEYVDTFLLCGSIVVAISTLLSSDAIRIFRNMVKGGTADFTVSYSLGTIILDLIIIAFSVGIVHYICKSSFELTQKSEEHKAMSKKKLIPRRFFIGAAWGLLVAVGLILLVKLASFTVITANLFIVLIVAGGMYALHKVINFQQ
ncbi:hypothetical protein [Clostridium aminobutyricum]|uniref:DUF1129 family protein n=1 Tax=Clostridium aminobutyricum TaxID=33953 RepID=A0A939DA37_CLOAM|nr:hypothetical protein [Clostridium aminobutyricum]MBN7773842.1 hypothetical protein [Clostridium aminobutyricum]